MGEVNHMNVLVTGCAGFIGSKVTEALLKDGHTVLGIDNLNNYYDVNLKKNRIKTLIKIAKKNKVRFYFEKKDLKDQKNVNSCFKKYKIKKVIHLAAQAGVRYSLKNPHSYVTSNITGFLNILEACRSFKVKHLIFASTSSVYGNSKKIPFKESDLSINPIQFYYTCPNLHHLDLLPLKASTTDNPEVHHLLYYLLKKQQVV